MKIDGRGNAVSTAKYLAQIKASPEQVADALLRAHLEGIDQARSALAQGQSLESVSKELDVRRKFILSQVESEERPPDLDE